MSNIDIEDRFTTRRVFQIVITLIGLISAVIGIYTFAFQEKKNEISFEILTNTNVLDINADVTKLDITYDGTSLKTNKENLRIINLRIKNTGSESILKNYYDNNDPLGLTITKGRIIEKPELVSTSNDYLQNNLKITTDSTGKIYFNDVILEANEFFTLKLLILHPSNSIPEIHPKGKIAGIKNLNFISQVQQAKEEKSFWVQTFGGNIFSQILRGLAYTLIVILIIVAIVISVESISDFRKKRKRIRIVKKFKELQSYDYNRMDDAIFARFEKDSSQNLLRYQNLLRDENRLNQKYKNWVNKLKRNVEEEIKEGEISSKELLLNDTFFTQRSEWTLMNEMISDGYAIKEKDELIVNQPMRKSLIQFIDYLKDIRFPDVKEKRYYGGGQTTISTTTEG